MSAATTASSLTVSTTPSGFVRAAISAADSSSRPAPSLIASPLLNAPIYAGRIQSAHAASGATVLTGEPGTDSPAALIDLGRPHGAFVTSGVFEGFMFRVTGATESGVVVDAQGFDLGQILAPGDAFEVRPLHTFRSLFGSDAVQVALTASTDAAGADQLMLCRNGVWRAYWFTGSAWRRSGSAGDAGDDVILPQDGLVVYRRSSTPLDVCFVGEAPETDVVLSVPAGTTTAIANPFPIDATIGEFGFETLSGWRSALAPDQADHIQVRCGQTWRTIWHDGASWRHSDGTSPLNEAIPAGTAMIVIRKAGETSNPFALISRPYDL